MAFSQDNLMRATHGARVVGNAMPVAYFSYATNDPAATVEAGGYFNAATNQLRKGDVIDAHLDMAGTPKIKRYIVTSATGAATVVVAAQTVA